MRQYLDYLEHIMQNGEERPDRTGTGVIGTFGYQMRFDLRKGFPLLTTKNVPLRLVFEELKWFLNGDTNIKYLVDKEVNIWNADAYRWYKTKFPNSNMTEEEFIRNVKDNSGFAKIYGELGPVYGKQWRSWNTVYVWDNDNTEFSDGTVEPMLRGQLITIDQISQVIESLKNDPYGRRHIVTAWNPADLKDMALPPCHLLFQFYVSNDKELSCQLYQRSADSFLGVPFNIASYSLLIHLIANELGYQVGEFVHTIGDAHIYKNHYDQIFTQLSREPKELPTLKIKRKDSIFNIGWSDIELLNYKPDSAIRGKVSVGK